MTIESRAVDLVTPLSPRLSCLHPPLGPSCLGPDPPPPPSCPAQTPPSCPPFVFLRASGLRPSPLPSPIRVSSCFRAQTPPSPLTKHVFLVWPLSVTTATDAFARSPVGVERLEVVVEHHEVQVVFRQSGLQFQV